MASILCAAFQIVVLATAAESYTDLNRELVEGVYASIFCELLEVEHVPRNRHDQLVPPTAEVNLLLVNMQKQTVECFNPGEVYDSRCLYFPARHYPISSIHLYPV